MSVVTVESVIEEENRLLKAALWAMPIEALQAVLDDPLVTTVAKEAIKNEVARRRCWVATRVEDPEFDLSAISCAQFRMDTGT